MLGWEFPPFISGGLGTACYGLTKAMSQIGVDVMFVLPRPVATAGMTHVKLVAPSGGGVEDQPLMSRLSSADEFERVQFLGVDAVLDPYSRPADEMEEIGLRGAGLGQGEGASGAADVDATAVVEATPPGSLVASHELKLKLAKNAGLSVSGRGGGGAKSAGPGDHYGGDLMAEVQRYALLATKVAKEESFDVIHAHDWMTFPAGMAVAGMSGRPLVVHVHSTEFDRAGMHVNPKIYDIERRGMHAAMKVITVSHLTKNIVARHYGVAEHKIEVIYNAIETNGNGFDPAKYGIKRNEKLVLFLGRMTQQKGPEYFLAAAKKVLEVMENVKFVMAGSGDMTRRVIDMAAQMGIGHKVLFTGFLRGQDVDRIFNMADLYVMPSVSEPFGIAPLEAMSHDVPVLISKQSGVSEVLNHALKVDFWDVNEMANKIVSVLKHPPLASTLRQHGAFEVRKLSWQDSARACTQVYAKAAQMVNFQRV